ncbi:hypothetical protein K402DRAFT_456260 [Aulographum hederae CBS 113979]|uniref:Uncharacterized protein n=1 Tax=Aulographum hederae CBS 113979 TaxID=1176131 RepID=A0A6G1GS51_9PEZI|nr:hypothetical protein K402DRAFT_456260 [Aulographum hederae CBS 113979]
MTRSDPVDISSQAQTGSFTDARSSARPFRSSPPPRPRTTHFNTNSKRPLTHLSFDDFLDTQPPEDDEPPARRPRRSMGNGVVESTKEDEEEAVKEQARPKIRKQRRPFVSLGDQDIIEDREREREEIRLIRNNTLLRPHTAHTTKSVRWADLPPQAGPYEDPHLEVQGSSSGSTAPGRGNQRVDKGKGRRIEPAEVIDLTGTAPHNKAFPGLDSNQGLPSYEEVMHGSVRPLTTIQETPPDDRENADPTNSTDQTGGPRGADGTHGFDEAKGAGGAGGAGRADEIEGTDEDEDDDDDDDDYRNEGFKDLS